jgi:16S rRNA (cytosine1402-N4)-methyltransferase
LENLPTHMTTHPTTHLTKAQTPPLHTPVLLSEILQMAAPSLEESKTKILDLTFGRGGHLTALLEKFPGSTAILVDQDLEAIEFAKNQFAPKFEGRIEGIFHGNFSEYKVPEAQFDLILADLGVSSPQLDQGGRGFSFYKDGPLDMRMNQLETLTAETVVNEFEESELVQIFKEMGEVRSPFRVVRAIVHDRKTVRFQSTSQLAGLIERVDGWQKKSMHPATLYFQGLRIFVNAELESLRQSLPQWIHGLRPKGRLQVLTFHSLEDRIVKQGFKALMQFGAPVHKKVIVGTEEEGRANPRSRSAKLRVFEKDFHPHANKINKYSKLSDPS